MYRSLCSCSALHRTHVYEARCCVLLPLLFLCLYVLCVCVHSCVCCAATDKSRTVVRLRNVMMELRKVVNHPSLLGLDLDSPAYTAAVSRRNEAAAAAAEAKGTSAARHLQ